MVRELKTGKAQSITHEDFNALVKRLLADKPEPRNAELQGRSFRLGRPSANN